MTRERSPNRNADIVLAMAKHLNSAGRTPRAQSLCLPARTQHHGPSTGLGRPPGRLGTGTRGESSRRHRRTVGVTHRRTVGVRSCAPSGSAPSGSGLAFLIPTSFSSSNQSADVRNRKPQLLCQCGHRDAAIAIGRAQGIGSICDSCQAILQSAWGFALYFWNLNRRTPLR